MYYLQCGSLVRGPLAGPLALQSQLNEQLQQVDQQVVHHVLRLQVGRDVGQRVDHGQGAVSTQQQQQLLVRMVLNWDKYRHICTVCPTLCIIVLVADADLQYPS